MWIQSCEAVNFRNLTEDRVHFESGLNWLYGANGQGKTNCLEMIYFALTSKSFRASRASDLLCDKALDGRAHAEVKRQNRSISFAVTVSKGKTTRYLAGKTCKSTAFFQSAAAISFTSRSKNLVEGSPSDRRLFMDRMIAYIDPEHMLTLARYRKTHNQLKQILYRSKNLAVYRSFKSALVPIALKLVERRLTFLDSISRDVTEIYAGVFSGVGKLHFAYKQKGVSSYRDLGKRMMDVCAQEILHGKSLVGPHLDDLEINVEQNRAKHRASSGQVRAIVLSMKIAVRESYKNRLNSYPILLLDDIDAELDSQRLAGLIKFLSGRGQTIITTSKYATIGESPEGSVFEVSAGRISPKGMVNDN